MTCKEEDYILESLDHINDFLDGDLKIMMEEVHENNIMLHEIIKVINTYISRHHQENDEDFMRNIAANLISNGIFPNR